MRNYLSRLMVIAFVSVLLFTPILKAQTNAKASETLVLANVTVIDGNGGRPKPNMTMVISNGRILNMHQSGRKKPLTGATVMDLSGQYVIPGLIDSHYHLNLGTRSKAEEEAFRRFALLGGITAVRDMAGDGIALAELAKVASDGKVQSPRVYFSALMAGKTWFVDQRVSIIMHGLPAGEAAWARAIMPDTDIVTAIAEAKNTGATGIKLYADLPPAIVTKITKEAHRQGLKVWSHSAIFSSKPSDAVKAGVDVLSHSHFLAWELVSELPEVSDKASNRMVGWTSISVDSPKITALLKQMRKQGTMLDDTVIWSILRFLPAIERAEAAKPEAERTPGYAKAIENWTYNIVNRVHKFGIPIVAGTDFQEQPKTQEFPNLHTELGLLVTKCGLTPLEAIKTATLNGAIALGVQNSFGTIAKGKVADLVILSADPSADIRNTTKILYVIKGGRVHKREKVIMQSASLGGDSSSPHNRPAKGEDLIPFESVARGSHLNSDVATKEGLDAPSLVVARNRTEAECLIRLLNLIQVEADQINRVDFNREWLVAVVRGIMGHGGYGISVEKINRTPEGINISVNLIDPDPRLFQQQNMPHPFHLIRVPREEVNSAPQDTWIVSAIKGKLLTQTGRVPTC